MAHTIEDLFKFLQQDKIDCAIEREKDKNDLKELIKQGVQNEVKALVEPVSERLSTVEQEQDNVSKQIKVISDELKELKEELKNRQAVSQSATSEVHAPRQMIIQTQVSDRSESQTQKDNTVSNELLKGLLAFRK